MLNAQRDIANAKLPLLMQSSNGDWSLVVKVTIGEAKYNFHIVERLQEELTSRIISQQAAPFYIGADVWELDYGATLMTLHHASLTNHPANELWQQYLA